MNLYSSSILAQLNYDIQFLERIDKENPNTICFDIQLRSANQESWKLAGQNYRLYYDASKVEFKDGYSLLGKDYQGFNLSQHIYDVDASSTDGDLAFDQHLGFLNFSIDLLDPTKAGIDLPTDDDWLNTAQVCFFISETSKDSSCNNLDIVWARNTRTNKYATSFTEISAWTGFNQTKTTAGETYLDQVANCLSSVTLNSKVVLQGALATETDALMQDHLRRLNYLPLTEPYSQLLSIDNTPYFQHLNGGETTTKDVYQISGADAIVDWVLLELRPANDVDKIVATRAALLQRDGDIVDIDGKSGVEFNIIPADYFISVRHRNHLGVMTENPVYLSGRSSLIDFSAPATPLNGNDASKIVNDRKILWSGDADCNHKLVFEEGDSNLTDKHFILSYLLSHNDIIQGKKNYVFSGYHTSDLNMDGETRYQGKKNDVLNILHNVLSHPKNKNLLDNFFFTEQIPNNHN